MKINFKEMNNEETVLKINNHLSMCRDLRKKSMLDTI